jgi:hypothetical protein
MAAHVSVEPPPPGPAAIFATGDVVETPSIVAAARDWRRMALDLCAEGDLVGALSMFARVRACVLQVALAHEPAALAIECSVLAAEAWVAMGCCVSTAARLTI